MKKLDITHAEEQYFKEFVEVYLSMSSVIRQLIHEHFDPSQHGQIALTARKGKWQVDMRVDGEWYNLYTYDVPEESRSKFHELAAILAEELNSMQDDDDDEDEEDADEQPQSTLKKEVEELKNYLADKGIYI